MELEDRICRVCKKLFQTDDARKRSCSKICAHKAKPKHYKRHDLKKNYNMTIEHWETLFQAQKGRCKICDKHQSEFAKCLSVDHDHATGRIRGLLCHKCNRALGFLNEDPALFTRAVEYLAW